MTFIPCLECGRKFERSTRGAPPKYCPPCRAERRLATQRARRDELDADRQLIRDTAEGMRGYLDPSMYGQVEAYVQSLGVPMSTAPIVPDRMPTGSNSPSGPDDGVSTTYPDLQAELEARRLQVIMHDWFTEHPHWAEGIHD